MEKDGQERADGWLRWLRNRRRTFRVGYEDRMVGEANTVATQVWDWWQELHADLGGSRESKKAVMQRKWRELSPQQVSGCSCQFNS